MVFFNFRADRARQLSYALLGGEAWAEFERCHAPRIHFASMMQYDRQLDTPYAFALPPLSNSLAEVLSHATLRQYHTAETEKYAHVTYFFNAQREDPFPGEERKLVASPKVATYDLKPEMSAPELTEATLERIGSADDDFILINYANPDMVGHTGVLEAAIKACETVDEGMGRVVEAVRAKGGGSGHHRGSRQRRDHDRGRWWTPHRPHYQPRPVHRRQRRPPPHAARRWGAGRRGSDRARVVGVTPTGGDDGAIADRAVMVGSKAAGFG